MIRKKPAPHLMRVGFRFSLATNAKRLPGDHAPTKSWSGMTIRRKVIPLRRFFWVCAIPNGPDRMAVKTSAASMRCRRLLPRWPLVHRVVFEAWKRYRRAARTRSDPAWTKEAANGWGMPPEFKVKSTVAQILGASSACSRFDKQPLVTKFEISIETLPGMCMAKGYAACAYRKKKKVKCFSEL